MCMQAAVIIDISLWGTQCQLIRLSTQHNMQELACVSVGYGEGWLACLSWPIRPVHQHYENLLKSVFVCEWFGATRPNFLGWLFNKPYFQLCIWEPPVRPSVRPQHDDTPWYGRVTRESLSAVPSYGVAWWQGNRFMWSIHMTWWQGAIHVVPSHVGAWRLGAHFMFCPPVAWWLWGHFMWYLHVFWHDDKGAAHVVRARIRAWWRGSHCLPLAWSHFMLSCHVLFSRTGVTKLEQEGCDGPMMEKQGIETKFWFKRTYWKKSPSLRNRSQICKITNPQVACQENASDWNELTMVTFRMLYGGVSGTFWCLSAT
jgi:hypothetical protein